MSGFAASMPFYRDPRGNRLEAWTITTAADGGHVLWLRGPDEVTQQIMALAPLYRLLPPSATAGPTWTHALLSPSSSMQEPVGLLLQLLTEVLSLPSPVGVDAALALDWYKKPEEGVDPYQWDNTPVGQLVRSGKYTYKFNEEMQSQVGLQLVKLLCETIERHGLLSQSTAVLNVPGHDSARVSFGSRMAATIARDRGTQMIKVATRSRFRPEAKNLAEADRLALLSNEFSVGQRLDGQQVLVVDDVFQTGTSMSAVASAARQSGAAKIYGICGVRTLKR